MSHFCVGSWNCEKKKSMRYYYDIKKVTITLFIYFSGGIGLPYFSDLWSYRDPKSFLETPLTLICQQKEIGILNLALFIVQVSVQVIYAKIMAYLIR